MKNKLTDLNNHLFAQLERLSDEDITGDNLTQEIERSKALTNVASQIISTGELALKGQKALNDGIIRKAPAMLGLETPDEI